MKFNKQLFNGTIFLPGAVLKISDFEESDQVEIHALKNTVIVMKHQMNAMELIQAMVAHKEHPIPSPTEEDPTLKEV